MKSVVAALKTNNAATDVPLSNDESLPFRPGLPVKQLNALFARCHNKIRNFEKDEEYAFADFSKLLFLKLLEEKHDTSSFQLPYSYRFHELATIPETQGDQVKNAILNMIEETKRKTSYGDVLDDPIRLKNPRTYSYIVRQLASVSFYDSSLDSKGAAFEYFVRATLKGKKLGQYFTPRPLVELMLNLVGRDKIVSSIVAGTTPKVLDPACGTGGFLVFMMQEALKTLDERYQSRQITKHTLDNLVDKTRQNVFFGSDANPGVACAAKMNMIISGDGHTNIRAENSLKRDAQNWSLNEDRADCDLIMTNPPFGTSEVDSLSPPELTEYPLRRPKGQLLFLQKMVCSTRRGGEICTVIDEGVLNTDIAAELRHWILQRCQVVAIIRLPEDTFKPNKINVRSSVLYLQRFEEDDIDLDRKYHITFCDVQSLGYIGSGEPIRGFQFAKLLSEVSGLLSEPDKGVQSGYHWNAFKVDARQVYEDTKNRLDYKYWQLTIREKLEKLQANNAPDIQSLNTISTERGSSPAPESYVDEVEGYALVVKAGSNISRLGQLIERGDYIEKNMYDEYVQNGARNIVQSGDVLLSSTGDGTLGKCCVYQSETPAVADSHVTIIRVDPNRIVPEYLCDYLRCGFGARQIERLYTGSTGLIELTPDHVNSILVDPLSGLTEQAQVSQELRIQEQKCTALVSKAQEDITSARRYFSGGETVAKLKELEGIQEDEPEDQVEDNSTI